MSDLASDARDAADRHEARGNTDTADLFDTLADEIERLRADLARVTQERDEARAIVAKLPKTADGVPLVPGDVVYAVARWLGKDGQVVEFLWNPASVYAWNEGTPTESWRVPITAAYSTREAAEAAREGK